MGEMIDLGRRGFLKIGAAAGGGLLIGFHLPSTARAADNHDRGLAPNAWLRIDRDDTVTVTVASSEMGQGVLTAIPMLLAEELDADWSKVRARQAPADKAYTNPLLGQQLTGGSTAIRGYWKPVREAGAVARDLLLSAAAAQWGVDAAGCRTESGAVLHPASQRRARYGELVDRAAGLPVPATVFLKEPTEFRLLGTPRARLDTPAKVNGSAVFGQDVRLPGMRVATVLRCPVFGGTVKSVNDKAARRIAGVREVLKISGGVAVVADDFWSAKRGRDALVVEWNEGANARLDSATISKRFAAAAQGPASRVRIEGDGAKALGKTKRRLEAVYEVPYLAHACMEPMNCTADVRSGRCELWVPTQAQTRAQAVAAQICGLTPDQVMVNTTFLGGGFGRRSEQDFVTDAVELSKAVGAPVKVMWTREDDIQHDFYRPATYNRLSAGIDARGQLKVWTHHIVGPSIFARVAPQYVKNGIDNTSVEGAANLPYAIANLEVNYTLDDPGVPVGFWRSVGSSQNAYVTECFLDEVAQALRKDPYQLRRSLLTGHPRHLAVLELAAGKAGWGGTLPKGRYRGIAVAESFGSYVAQVAEVSVTGDQVKVHRVVCAVDCGQIVNPATIEAQMQSAIVYGLTAALYGEISLRDGRVVQSNFHDYPALRMPDMPQVEVHIVKSSEPPGGGGEPGTPPIAPAVANAVFAATGKPVRRLPIRLGAAAAQ